MSCVGDLIVSGVPLDVDGSLPKLKLLATAGEDLSGHRAVMIENGEAFYCDADDAAHMGRAVGITVGAALEDGTVEVQTAGPVTEPSWAWTPGPVFIGAEGTLTQDATVPTAFLQVIGWAIAATKLYIQPEIPFLKAA